MIVEHMSAAAHVDELAANRANIVKLLEEERDNHQQIHGRLWVHRTVQRRLALWHSYVLIGVHKSSLQPTWFVDTM